MEKENKRKKEKTNKKLGGGAPGVNMFNKKKEVHMFTFDSKYLFEDQEISNFQFFARPETFRGWKNGYYIVDGLLAICNEEGTKSFEASLYFLPVADAEDFEHNFYQEFQDWWLEPADPSLILVVDDDGNLKIGNEAEV